VSRLGLFRRVVAGLVPLPLLLAGTFAAPALAQPPARPPAASTQAPPAPPATRETPPDPAPAFQPVPVGPVDRPLADEPGVEKLAEALTLSARSELVRLDCTTEQRRREVTLFGSGTIRLREGVVGAEAGGLYDLKPDELTGYLNRMMEEDLSRVTSPDRGLDGAWISRCLLSLQLPGRPRGDYFYSQLDSLPLNLSRVLRVVEELAARVPDLKQAARLPDDFLPKRGDILKRQDGELFRVMGFTTDGKGIELEGQDIPLALYLTPEQVRHDFVALVRRNP
jgi:hypothetical protein